jgi:hypothetical protein
MGIFKRKPIIHPEQPNPEREAKREAIDNMATSAQESADEILRLIRRRRTREMLRGALGNGDNK